MCCVTLGSPCPSLSLLFLVRSREQLDAGEALPEPLLVSITVLYNSSFGWSSYLALVCLSYFSAWHIAGAQLSSGEEEANQRTTIVVGALSLGISAYGTLLEAPSQMLPLPASPSQRGSLVLAAHLV